MPSIRIIDISALVTTSVAWGAIGGVLLVDLKLRRLVETRLLFVGLLVGMTSSLVGEITHQLHLTHLARNIVDGMALLLLVAGLVVVLFAAVQLATRRGARAAPAPEQPTREQPTREQPAPGKPALGKPAPGKPA